MDVGIIGGSGYGGAELLRLLGSHPTLKVRTVAARTSAGRDLAEVFPHLGMSGRLAPSEPDAVAGCDVVFLATPHEASMALAPALLDQGAAVVDLSGAFRLDAATFSDWYGLAHAAPDLAPAAYGLPETSRGDLDGARLVANPGCYPTAALLALWPLAGLVDPATVVVAGLSGTSGAGKGLREDLHVSHAVANVSPYAAPRHRHTPEIEAGWARAARLPEPAPVSFTPHLVPMARGLLATVCAALTDGVDPAAVRGAYADAYAGEPFVTVLPEGAWPATAYVSGGNAAHVGVAVDPRTGRVTASCAIDNLGKGAAGQAIQNANIVLGLPEAAGLSAAGVYP
ncbi:MAG TPA: N-acetyl-gamma-glutamyl-phosphate reductase [Egibacteraceae bacterium]|nr:N-acetyl-gamma-glutamyl-phosphate reductase [Egibacteraceae bacterium]